MQPLQTAGLPPRTGSRILPGQRLHHEEQRGREEDREGEEAMSCGVNSPTVQFPTSQGESLRRDRRRELGVWRLGVVTLSKAVPAPTNVKNRMMLLVAVGDPSRSSCSSDRGSGCPTARRRTGSARPRGTGAAGRRRGRSSGRCSRSPGTCRARARRRCGTGSCASGTPPAAAPRRRSKPASMLNQVFVRSIVPSRCRAISGLSFAMLP